MDKVLFTKLPALNAPSLPAGGFQISALNIDNSKLPIKAYTKYEAAITFSTDL